MHIGSHEEGRTPIPRAQVAAPALPARWLHRERLLTALDEAVGHGLALVTAPPGHGKSSLVAAWCRSRARRVAWITFDRRDDDADGVRDRLLAGIRHATSAPPTPVEPGASPDDAVMASLDDLAAVPDAVLVLDDLDALTSEPAHDLVRYVLTWMPASIDRVVSTRSRPLYLPLSQLGWRDQLGELRSDSLSFTPEETEAYLNGAWRLDLHPADVRTIWERVGGWPAAVHLVAVQLAEAPDLAADIVAGRRPPAADLLTGILDGELREDARFLVQCSVLERLTPDLCRAVTGSRDTPMKLRRLAHRGLLQVTGGESGTTGEYVHNRFLRDLLRAELADRTPSELPVLHGRAARWFADRGELLAAIRHGDAAGLGGLVLEEVGRDPGAVVAVDGGQTLRRVVAKAAPDRWGTADTALAAHLELSTLAGDAEAVAAVLARLELGPGPRHPLAQRALLHLARLHGDDVRGIEHVDPASRDPLVLQVVGMQRGLEGRHDPAGTLLGAALEHSTSSGDPLRQLVVAADLSWMRIRAGELHQGDLLVRRALRMATALGMATPLALQLAIATLALDRGVRRVAVRTAAAVRDHAATTGDLPLQLDAVLLGLRIDPTLARPEASLRRFLELRAGDAAARWGIVLVRRAGRVEADLRLRAGDVEGAVAAVPDLVTSTSPEQLDPGGRLLLARLLHGRDRHDDARRVLTGLQDAPPRVAMEAARFEAALAAALGDTARARAASGRSRRIAASQGFREATGMHDAGPGTTPPAPRSGPPTTAAPRRGDRAGAMLVEGLTGREVEVLRALGSRAPYRVVAGELHISVNTLKTHLKAVYRKLGVASRSQAVDRAEELGLA